MADTTAPLFSDGITHIEVQCVACPHLVTLLPQDLPQGITALGFESKAKCAKCGAGWP